MNTNRSIMEHKSKNFDFSLFQVSMADDKRITDSSSKIEMIFQKVHDLKRAEANVKIVIFSQWTSNLLAIGAALASTNITYRSDTRQFYKTIQEFKVTFKKNDRLT